MENHTKGIWAWQKFGNKYLLTAQHGFREIIIGANIVDPDMGYIECYPSMNDDGLLKPIDPTHPNAKLIAAAPDLLNELKKVRLDIKLSGVFKEDSPIVQGIDSVIQKAIG